jgi:hypothetical protein
MTSLNVANGNEIAWPAINQEIIAINGAIQ